MFFENTSDGAYATLFFGEYDERRQTALCELRTFAGLLLRRDGSVEKLEATCMVLGFLRTGSARWTSAAFSAIR